ncbi:hypothetical protein DITRI_Ditri15bG0043800 [Diplodiscus trichospermus]
MGVYLVFYFILILWLIQAAKSQQVHRQSRCRETCGDVFIPFPFGIKSGCYSNSWFRVTCNETANGPKPFITRINLELLGSFRSDGDVAVHNPVTYLNCGNKGNDGTTPPVSVNLDGSPFFFSSRFNLLGSVGCGNLATVFRNNQTYPIASCLQPRCGNPTSNLSGCFAEIPQHLTWYSATMIEIINHGKQEYDKSCTSAFLFDRSRLNSSGPDLKFPQSISIDTTHVPATLEWNLVLEEYQEPHKVVCSENERCGNVDIPYPFGIKEGCYMNEWFRVSCNQTRDGPKPFISSINMQMLNASFSQGIVIVNNSVTYSNCPSEDEDNNGVSVNLTGSPFFFSHIFNRFVSVGCGYLATILPNRIDYPVGGCLQPPCSSSMTSNVGCLMKIPPGLSSFAANMTEIYPRNGSKRSCGSAFMVHVGLLNSRPRDVNPDGNDILSWTPTTQLWGTPKVGHIPSTLQWGTPMQLSTPKGGYVPTTLQWGTPKRGFCELKDGSNTSCSSSGQYCWTRLSPTHLCVCSADVDSGNDGYYTDVCKETHTCGEPEYKYCHMLCLNAPGNYCSSCPDQYQYSSAKDRCNPIDLTPRKPPYSTTPEFTMEEPKKLGICQSSL